MTAVLTCIIVDDDYLDRLSVELELKGTNHMRLLGSFSSALEVIEFIKNNKPDVLFLDVDMPDISGLQLFKSINSYSPVCIVISSYPEYALESFELKVFDYILKPLTAQRFNDTMMRLSDFYAIKQKAAAYASMIEREKVVFKQGHDEVHLDTNEIIYLEAFGDYTKVVTNQKIYLTLATLSSFLDHLSGDKFLRIHRSYAVARSQINLVCNNTIEVAGVNLPVGKTYRSCLAQIKLLNGAGKS